jgi:predicted DsbA family dithiol-disulfide isomerase
MADEGLPYSERNMTYNSRLAQEFAKWAESQPNGEQIHDALFRAYFVDNQNLADVDNLVTIAEQVGLSASEARTVLEERRFSKHVDSDWQRSRELGVTGVPTFVIKNQALVGAQPYEQLATLMAAAGVELYEPLEDRE